MSLTKDDLAAISALLEEQQTGLREEMRGMLEEQWAALNAQQTGLREEMKGMLEEQQVDLRAEMKGMLEEQQVGLRAEMKEMLEEQQAGLRVEMKGMLEEQQVGLRTEMRDMKKELLSRLRETENTVLEEVDRVQEIGSKNTAKLAKELEELKAYYRINHLENENLNLFMKMVVNLEEKVKKLESKIA